MMSNRHVVVALLVAPLLSLLAWFAVDKLVAAQPDSAVAGEVYPLLEKSNCRYASGVCELENGDVQLTLNVRSTAELVTLELHSSLPLQQVLIALVPAGEAGNHGDGGEGPKPAPMMSQAGGSGTQWQMSLSAPPAAGTRLRLVASTSSNHFTAEVATEFARVDG